MTVSIKLHGGNYQHHLSAYAANGNMSHHGAFKGGWFSGTDYATTRTGSLDGQASTEGFVAKASSGTLNYSMWKHALSGKLGTVKMGSGINSDFTVTAPKVEFDFHSKSSSGSQGMVHKLIYDFRKPLGKNGDQTPFKVLNDYLDTQTINWRGTAANETFKSYKKIDCFRLADGGNDAIEFSSRSSGHDLVIGFDADNASAGHDVLKFASAVFSSAQAAIAAASQVGANTVLTIDAANTITLKNVSLASFDASDLVIV